ncbi:MAG: peptidylprolyl isomerase [Bacteroidia bacterium]|nr:peptidylprolyl isomerase [Bacteroidia bacterium]
MKMNFVRRMLPLLALVVLVSVQGFGQKEKKAKEKKVVVKPDVVVITTYGNIYIDLFDDTPGHRDNFLKLTREGVYDGTTFHRVISDFMIQGGDPYSKDPAKTNMAGQGGPGYTLPAEISDKYVHLKGMLAAARQSDQVNPKRESSGSQFYLVQGKSVPGAQLDQMEKSIQQASGKKDFKYTPEQRKAYEELGGTPWLDMQYTIFGQVVWGMEVIDKIAAVEKGPGDRPKTDITMEVKVLKKWNDKKKVGKW